MTNKCSNCETENSKTAKYCSVCGFKLPILEAQNDLFEVSKKTVKNSKRLNIKSSLGFAVGFVVMFFLTQYLFKPSIDEELVEFSNEFNKNCPMNVDQYTTLKNTVALPNKTLQYNYILEGMTKTEVNLDTVKKYVFPGILENVKTNPDMKLFRDNEVTLNYYYMDKNGVFVTEYKIKPEMYK